MRTSKSITIEFRSFGEITIPKGTLLTNQTACGFDANYHFVQDFSWIKRDYPRIANILTHDVRYYGINIQREFVDFK